MALVVIYNELYGPDDFGLYIPADEDGGDYSPVDRGDYVQAVRNAPHMPNKIAYDFATKLPIAAGGTRLSFFNVLGDESDMTGAIHSINIFYETEGTGIGTATERSGSHSWWCCGLQG